MIEGKEKVTPPIAEIRVLVGKCGRAGTLKYTVSLPIEEQQIYERIHGFYRQMVSYLAELITSRCDNGELSEKNSVYTLRCSLASSDTDIFTVSRRLTVSLRGKVIKELDTVDNFSHDGYLAHEKRRRRKEKTKRSTAR